MLTTPPLVAISTKAYFGVGQTRRWVRQVADLGRAGLDGAEIAVLPSFPLLESTASTLAGTGIGWGAQDCAASAAGAQTGEVLAATLAELGCTYVEVGHAERRTLFGESDAIVREKTARVLDEGMVPLLCVGEESEGSSEAAAAWCVRQVRHALDGTPDAPVVVAYEPLWAIGAARPAPAEHVLSVAAALRDALATRTGSSRVLYGGAAGPGTAAALGTGVDGLFLGRFAHDVDALHRTVREVVAAHAPPPAATRTTAPSHPHHHESRTP